MSSSRLSRCISIGLLLALGAVTFGCEGDDANQLLGPTAPESCTGPESTALLATFEDFDAACPVADTLNSIAEGVEVPVECNHTELGTPLPDLALEQLQPFACTVGEELPLRTFTGKPTVVALLSSWCSYCQGQALKLEEMWWSLKAEGIDANFVIINDDSNPIPSNFTQRVSFSVLQDTETAMGWETFAGGKDDFYIYDANGLLHAYLPHDTSGEEGLMTYLGEEEGYNNLATALRSAASVTDAETASASDEVSE